MTCFRNGPQRVFAPDVKQFYAKVHDKRWGTGMHAGHALLPLRIPLNMGWSKARYTQGAPIADDDNDDEDGAQRGVKVERADRAISNMEFWGFMIMVDVVGVLFLYMSGWFDTCPCHGEIPGLRPGDYSHQTRRSYWARKSERDCRMSGRRSFEFAAGEMLAFVRRSRGV